MLRIRSVCFHVDNFCFRFVVCALLVIVIKVSMTPQLLMFKSVTSRSFYWNLKPSWKVWIIRFWNPSYNIIDIMYCHFTQKLIFNETPMMNHDLCCLLRKICQGNLPNKHVIEKGVDSSVVRPEKYCVKIPQSGIGYQVIIPQHEIPVND